MDRVSEGRVREAYAHRSAEYVALLGSVEQMDARDRSRILDWAAGVRGPVLDAGCGPGHWTAFLGEQGHEAVGVDMVPSFIESARARFPAASFRVGSVRALEEPDASFGGVLAWYSLIHEPPGSLPDVLTELRRVIAPGGRVLVGFFDGAAGEPFAHAVTTAYFSSPDAMAALLDASGFEVIDVEQRRDEGRRPHASISARAPVLTDAPVPVVVLPA